MGRTRAKANRRDAGPDTGLPKAMRNALKEARKCTPRFLFRGFSEQSGGGVSPDLNTELGIVPHAFLKSSTRHPHSSIIAFNPNELYNELTNHLTGGRNPTELSSWAFTIQQAISFAKGSRGSRIRLGVVDAYKLDRAVEAYHVPKLESVFRSYVPEHGHGHDAAVVSYPDSFSCYPHEYLMHGKVKGHGFHTLMLANADTCASNDPWEENHKPDHRLEQFTSNRADIGAIEVWEVREATSMAREFSLEHDKRRELFAFLVVHILALRISRKRSAWYEGEADTILSTLQDGGVRVPGTFMREDWIMLDVVDDGGYRECSMTVEMLRALVYRQFGENAVRAMRNNDPALEDAKPFPQFKSPENDTAMPEHSAGAGYGSGYDESDWVEGEERNGSGWAVESGIEESGYVDSVEDVRAGTVHSEAHSSSGWGDVDGW